MSLLRVRGPFSVAIFLLALIETLHWSLAAGDASSPDFFEREVDNVRHIQTSFLSSGDNIMRIAAKIAERETGRKRTSDQALTKKWNEPLRERFRDQIQVLSSRASSITPRSQRSTAENNTLNVRVGQATMGSSESASSTTTEGGGNGYNALSTFFALVMYIAVTTIAHFGSSVFGQQKTASNFGRRAFVPSLLILPLLFAPALSSSLVLDSNLLAPLLPSAASASDMYITSSPVPLSLEDSCDLSCWLSSLKIHIPDQSFTKIGVTGTVTNGLCTGLAFGNLQSSLVPPAGLRLAASGLSIQCSLDWGLQAAILSAQGSANAVVNNSQLDVGLQLWKDSDGLAMWANLTTCSAKIVVTSLEFQGDLSIFLDLFRSEISYIISSTLDSVICGQLKTLVQTNMTNALQGIDSFVRPFMRPHFPATPPVYPAGMVSLPHNPLVGVVDYLFDDVIGADGVLGLNKIVNVLTNGSGNITVPNMGLSLPVSLASLGVDLTLHLKSVSISGLNSWSLFDVFEPAGLYNLTSRTRLDSFGLDLAFAVNVSVNGSLGVAHLYEEARLVADLADNSLHSTLQVAIREDTVKSLTNNQMIVPGCIKSTIYDLNMTELDFSFDLSHLALVASTTTGGDAEQQLDAVINTVFALFTNAFQPAIPAVFNGLVAGPVRLMTNIAFAALIELNATCTNPSSPETFNLESTIMSFSGAGGAFVFLLAIGVVVGCLSQVPRLTDDDEEAHRAPLIVDDDRGVVTAINGEPGQADEDDSGCGRSKWLSALLFSPRLPVVLRYGIVMLLLGNIALFISSNTSVGASVYVYVQVGHTEPPIKLPSLFDFSLGNSVVDMWHAKVYALSLLIAIFSGAWPYLKLVMLLMCWIVPARLLTPRHRERVLMALDILGKWSLIDAFVLTLMMVAFHFRIVPPVSPHTPPGTTRVDAYVEPHWGFYSFLVATMLSLATTHVILASHRADRPKPAATRDVVSVNDDDVHDEDQRHPYSPLGAHKPPSPHQQHKWQALCTYAFKSNCALSRWSKLVSVVVTVLLLFSIALLITGSVIRSFEFQFRGAFDLLLDFLGESSSTSYSIISTGLALPGSAFSPNSVGVRFIQATWFSFAIAIPLCYLVLLLVLWLTPMTPRLQRAVFVITEVFNAWSALEVVVVSIIAALLELQQFSQFIIGSRCDLINPLLEKYMGPYLDGDAKCFDVVATLDDGCWLLFAACVIYIIVGLGVQITCHKALREREGELALIRQHNAAAAAAASDRPPIGINGSRYEDGNGFYYR